MKLLKSTDKTNIGNIDKIYIIKDIYVLAFPESNEIMQSEIALSDEKNFEEISITDGTLEISDDNKGNGNIFNFKVNFRHPKVRVDADNFFNKYRGKLVRLIVTDKNNLSYFSPKGFLKIKQSIPAIPDYSGYTVEFTGTCETLQSVTLDTNYTPPANWIYLDKAYHPIEIAYQSDGGIQFINNPENFIPGDFTVPGWITIPSTTHYIVQEPGIYKFHLKVKINIFSNYNPEYTKLKFILLRGELNQTQIQDTDLIPLGINMIDQDVIFTCEVDDIITLRFEGSFFFSYNYIETLEQFLSVSKLE